MKIDLKDYFSKRDEFVEAMQVPGPVITISREYGIPAIPLAQQLIKILNARGHTLVKDFDWQYINKEILETSAHELHINPAKLHHIFEPHEKNFWEDFFASFSHDYDLDDHKLHQTVKDVIYKYAKKGNVVIIGRGGVAIARDIEKSLHVKLQAPLEWRIEKVADEFKLSFAEAKVETLKHDERRNLCIDHLRGEKCGNSLFDLHLNRVTMTDEEMIEVIVKMMEIRHLY